MSDELFTRARATIEADLKGYFPNAERDGREYRLGNVSGAPGRSLTIFPGNDRMRFHDKATDEKGDLLDLFCTVYGCQNVAEAAEKILGDTATRPAPAPQKRSPGRPAAPEAIITPPADDPGPRFPSMPDLVTRYVPGYVIARWNTPTGKDIRPYTFTAAGWVSTSPKTRPLYRPDRIAEAEAVLVVEGEKCLHAAESLGLPGIVCTTFPHGAKSIGKVDLSPLAGKRIIIWPDRDVAGMKAARSIKKKYTTARILRIPRDKPKGWDIADCLAEENGAEIARNMICPPAPAITKTNQAPAPTFDASGKFTHLESKPDQKKQNWVWAMLEGVHLIDPNAGNLGNLCHAHALADLDPDFSRLILWDEATCSAIFSRRYKTIDEIYNAIMRRGLIYGMSFAMQTRRDVADSLLSRPENRVNSILDFIADLEARHPDADPEEALAEFLSLVVVADNAEADIIAGIWRHFFTRRLVSLHSAFSDSPVPCDVIPILLGPQGCGKSTLCRFLGFDSAGFFADIGDQAAAELATPDTIRKIAGKLTIELGELAGLRRGDLDKLKAFFSRTSDPLVRKYREAVSEIPRTACFIGTGNSETFLRDTTGNRRFYPMRVHSIDVQRLAETGREIIGRLYAAFSRKARAMLEQGPTAIYKTATLPENIQTWLEGAREDADALPVWYARAAESIDRIEAEQLDQKNTLGRPVSHFKILEAEISDRTFGADRLASVPADFMPRIAALLGKRGYTRNRLRLPGGERPYGWTRPRPAK